MSTERKPMRRTPRSGVKQRTPLRRVKKSEPAETKGPKPFRVLVMAHRPRYRARIERAAEAAGWVVESLLNRQDPIGILQSNPPDVLVITVDSAINRNVGYLKAAQPFRDKTQVIALFETADERKDLGDFAEAVHTTPWRTREVRASLAAAFTEIRGYAPTFPHPLLGMEDGSDELAEE